jgi:hypothetical protein
MASRHQAPLADLTYLFFPRNPITVFMSHHFTPSPCLLAGRGRIAHASEPSPVEELVRRTGQPRNGERERA